jgi:hypothetical protein
MLPETNCCQEKASVAHSHVVQRQESGVEGVEGYTDGYKEHRTHLRGWIYCRRPCRQPRGTEREDGLILNAVHGTRHG